MVAELSSVLSARRALLLRRPHSGLSGPQTRLRLECRWEEGAGTKGRRFFTEDDFKRFNRSSLSGTMRRLLVSCAMLPAMLHQPPCRCCVLLVLRPATEHLCCPL